MKLLILTATPSSPIITFMVPVGTGLILIALYLLNHVYVMAVTEAAGPGQAQEATDISRPGDSIRLADFTRWVAGMAVQLSGARGQASTLHEMPVLGDQGKRLWLSHMVGTEITNFISSLHLFVPDSTPTTDPGKSPERGAGTSAQ